VDTLAGNAVFRLEERVGKLQNLRSKVATADILWGFTE
jgi:hypothetical protein